MNKTAMGWKTISTTFSLWRSQSRKSSY